MKPIKLKIKGLNSYRDEQVIDFENLLVGGVFGIFGPTGSGKSTILDGITIALYGYEAIPRETKDFINTESEKAYIYFEFAIDTVDGRSTYIIERSIKENKTGGISTDYARLLLRSDQGEMVLEDKVYGINNKIVEILGLRAEDFLRSVVLPQGKFSEFLKLKNKARCDMLERILGLQKYGERLSRKIAESRSTVKLQLSSKEGELKGYNTVDEDIVKLKKEELSKIIDEIDKNQILLDKLARSIEEDRILKGHYDELEKYTKTLADLVNRDNTIKDLEKRIDAYTKGQVIIPLVKSIDEGEARFESNTVALKALKDRKHIVSEELDGISSGLIELENWRRDIYPELSRLQVRLEEIIKLDKELKELEQDRLKLVAEYKQASSSLTSNRENLNTCKDKIEKLRLDLKTYEDGQKASLIDNEYRRSIIEGASYSKEKVSLEENINRIKKSTIELESVIKEKNGIYKEYVDNRKEKRSQLDLKKEELVLLRSNNDELRNGIFELREKISKLDIRITDIRSKNDRLKNAKLVLAASDNDYRQLELKKEYNNTRAEENKGLIKATKDAIEELKDTQLAGILASKLMIDKPCPVCGSSDHPSVSESVSLDEIEKLEKLRDGYDIDRLEIQKSSFDLDAQMLIISSKREEAVKTIDELADSVEGIDIDGAEKELSLMYKELEKSEAILKEQLTSLPLAQKEIDNLSQEIEILDRDIEGLRQELETSRIRERHDKEELVKLEKKHGELLNLINEIGEKLNITDFEGEIVRVSTMDKQYNDYVKKAGEAKSLIESMEKDERAIEKRIADDITKRDISEKLGKSKAEHISKKKAEINEVTKGEEPQIMLDATKDKITSGLKKHEELTSLREAKGKDLEAINKNQGRLEAENKMLLDNIEKSRKQLDTSLKQFELHDYKWILESAITEEQYKEYKTQIEEYNKSLNNANSNIDRVKAAIGDRKYNDAVDSKNKTDYLSAKDSSRVLIQNKGSLQSAIEELEKSLKQKALLLDELKAIESKLGLLNELFSLVKGKRFVEFIAISRLKYISREASNRLMAITNNRFSLELDSKGGFIICDNFNGGVRRDSNSLSGGETFLTSLALALSLSSHIQIKSSSSIEFFFMDEGFGTLDNHLLEMVMTSLEKLGEESLSVGIISHVQEIKDRINKKIVITPAEAGVSGSVINMIG